MTVVNVDAESLRQYAVRARMVGTDVARIALPDVPVLPEQATAAVIDDLHCYVAVHCTTLGGVAHALAADTDVAAQQYTASDLESAAALGGVL